MSFLKAEWRKLVLANYIIEPHCLEKYLPFKTELDLWEGNCYVSLVGFMFKNTRLLGLKIPFHVNFEEVNLRFYVRYHNGAEWRRGVVFIKEIVPKPALSLVANTFYREHYQTLPMRHEWQETDSELKISYAWKYHQKWQSMRVIADRKANPIQPGTETEFITEHYWGYTKLNEHATKEYQVVHPTWEAYPVNHWEINVDFGLVYGPDFSDLTLKAPHSVILAEGSEISVEKTRRI